jgi:CRP-like cAMP-binding protein
MDRAAEAYREHISNHPRDVEARRQLAELLEELGKVDSAISEYVKLQEVLAAAGHILGAIVAGKKVTQIDPTFNNPLSYVAKVQTDNLVEEHRRSADTLPDLKPVKPLSEIPLLADLAPLELESVAESMQVHERRQGDVIFNQGEEGESLFFVTRGQVEVATGSQELGRLGPGECFGEFSFLTEQPRAASVRALEATELLELSQSSMQVVVRARPRLREVLFKMYRERAMLNVLTQSPLFEMLKAQDREKVAGLMELVRLDAEEVVFQRGAPGDCLYLIKRGRVEVRDETTGGKDVRLAVLGPHQFFGEVSFLTGVPRTATIMTLEECELLKLPEEELQRLVRDYPELREVLQRFHLDRVMATAETLKAFLKNDRVEGILT